MGRKEGSIVVLLLLCLAIILIWMNSAIFIYQFFDDWGTRGTFGDSFGAINSLFSGFAFAGIVYTIFLQRSELKLQREDAKRSSEQLEGQIQLLNQQKFEAKFFQLLNLHHQIVSSNNSRYNQHGREIFQQVALSIKMKINNSSLIAEVQQAYLDEYNMYKTELGHYFRNLFHIVKFVSESKEIDKDLKYTYIRILRAQLSTYEILVLAYNGLSKYGREFKDLIEEYKLIKNIDFTDDCTVCTELLIGQYPHLKQAYGEQVF